MSHQALRDGLHLRALRSERRPQDRHDRRVACHVINVHRREAALVVMRVPERQLLTAMRYTERTVDVEDLLPARLHCRAGLINESCGEPRRLGLLGAFSRRLTVDCEAGGAPLMNSGRPRRSSAGHAAAGRGRRHPRGRTRLLRRAPSPSRTYRAGCGSHRGDPASHQQVVGTPKLALRLPQPPCEDWLPPAKSTVKSNCEFLALDRWKVEGKRCSVGHDGYGEHAIRRNTDLLRKSLALRHSRHINLMPRA